MTKRHEIGQSYIRSLADRGWSFSKIYNAAMSEKTSYRKTDMETYYREYTGKARRYAKYETVRKGYKPSVRVKEGFQLHAYSYHCDVTFRDIVTDDLMMVDRVIITADDKLSVTQVEDKVMDSPFVKSVTGGGGSTNWYVSEIKIVDVTRSEPKYEEITT